MVQLYFLSIVFSAVAGFLFIFGDMGKDEPDVDGLKSSFFGNGFRLILGILAAVTGILKLLSPMNKLPILGDLLPALAGIVAGFMLVFGFYREHSSTAHLDDEKAVSHFGEVLLYNKKLAGAALIIIAVLHFLFPEALFL